MPPTKLNLFEVEADRVESSDIEDAGTEVASVSWASLLGFMALLAVLALVIAVVVIFRLHKKRKRLQESRASDTLATSKHDLVENLDGADKGRMMATYTNDIAPADEKDLIAYELPDKISATASLKTTPAISSLESTGDVSDVVELEYI